MAHELTTNQDGQVEFAYLERDGLPWHGLGQAMPMGASIEDWRKQSGMDWRIQRSKVRYAVSRDESAVFEEMADQHVLFRQLIYQSHHLGSLLYQLMSQDLGYQLH